MTQTKQSAAQRALRAPAFQTHTGAEVFLLLLLAAGRVCVEGCGKTILKLFSFKLVTVTCVVCPCGVAVAGRRRT